MPEHKTYVEMGVGSGAVFRLKRQAARSILVDRDEVVRACWSASGLAVVDADMARSDTWPDELRLALQDPETVSYWDPPYPLEVRTKKSPTYRCEMLSIDEHQRLLEVIVKLPCRVLISGYWSSTYAKMLQDWRRVEFWAGTRGGKRKEHVWMNYDPTGLLLHDCRFVGEGYRERERIRKKARRWRRMLGDMSSPERQFVLKTIIELER